MLVQRNLHLVNVVLQIVMLLALLSRGEFSLHVACGLIVGLNTSVINLLGVWREHAKRKRRTVSAPFRLPSSFYTGLFGGVIGGAAAGLIIGGGYFIQFAGSDELVTLGIIPEIILYASAVGAVTGFSTQPAIHWVRHLVTKGQYPTLVFNEVTAGVFGGLVGGVVIGAFGGLWFGLREMEPINTDLLMLGSVLGPIPLVIGALLFDFHGRFRNVMLALVISVVATLAGAAVGWSMFIALGIDSSWFSKWSTYMLAATGGAKLGAVVGIMLGFQIGFALLLYRFLSSQLGVTTEKEMGGRL